MNGEIRVLNVFEFAQGEYAQYDLDFTKAESGSPEFMTGDKVIVELFTDSEIILRKTTPAASGIDDTKASQGKFILTIKPTDIPMIDALRRVTARVSRIFAADLTAIPPHPERVRVQAEGPAILVPSPRLAL